MWSNAGWLSDESGWYKNKAAGGSPSIVVTDNFVDGALGFVSSYTTTRALSIGSASATRFVVVAMRIDFTGSSDALTAVKLGGSGGTAFTKLFGAATATYENSMWGLTVASGTSSTIFIQCTGANMNIGAFGVAALDGLSSTTPTSSNTNNYNAFDSTNPVTFGSALAGSGIGFAFGYTNPRSATVAWNDGTTVSDSVVNTGAGTVGQSITGHVLSAGGAWKPAFSDSPNDISNLIAGTWN